MSTPITNVMMNLHADIKPVHVYRQAIVTRMLF